MRGIGGGSLGLRFSRESVVGPGQPDEGLDDFNEPAADPQKGADERPAGARVEMPVQPPSAADPQRHGDGDDEPHVAERAEGDEGLSTLLLVRGTPGSRCRA